MRLDKTLIKISNYVFYFFKTTTIYYYTYFLDIYFINSINYNYQKETPTYFNNNYILYIF